jgi:hypothetical protein
MGMSVSPAPIIGLTEESLNIQMAIADFELGKKSNIAIIAEPFAGKSMLLKEIERKNPSRVTRLSFSSIAISHDEISGLKESKRIILIDDCHFLYMRRIGGFEILRDFLEFSISCKDHLFITTWNLFSWNYLDEVMSISKYFPIQIRPPKFTSSQIKKYILSLCEGKTVRFIEDVEFLKTKLITIAQYPVTIKPLKKPIHIPFIKIDYNLIRTKLVRTENQVALEDIIYQKVYNISNGNPGVAKIIWEKTLENPEISPRNIYSFSSGLLLDFDESFILAIILSMKSIKKEEIAEIVGLESQIDHIIPLFLNKGLVQITDGYISVRPEALNSIVSALKKVRLVW